jgi:hypothetical protein
LFYLRGGAEGTQINWCQIGISIQLRENFKGLLKVNLRNLFDKTTQLNVENIYARDDCDPFDVLEDPSNPKGFVKLLIYFMNMCSANQQRVFCYPATKSKSFTKEMEKAGTSHIKINFKSNIGHNSMRKRLKTLTEKTGIPLPNKGSFGAHVFRQRALTGLKEKGVSDFETRLAFRHETETAHNMYPESELKMREQKYTAQMLNSKIVLLTMNKLNGDGDKEDDFIESKVINSPTEVKALPGTMLEKLFMLEGKPQQALRSFVQPPPPRGTQDTVTTREETSGDAPPQRKPHHLNWQCCLFLNCWL